MIYLTLEDWTNLFVPKLNNNILFVEEIKQTKKIHNILLEIITIIFPNKSNSENKLKQNILYASMIYYHKYILFNSLPHSKISEIEKVLICASCIFLSFKATVKQINIDELSGKLLPYLNNMSVNKKYLLEDINIIIRKYEYDILYAIGFNMGIDNPYDFLEYLRYYLKIIVVENNTIKEIIQLVNKFINDSLLFPLYLYYSSYDIIVSCILLAKESNNYNFINIDCFIQMYQLQIDNNKIRQCAKYISKITNFLIKNTNAIDKTVNEMNNNNQQIPQDNIVNAININTPQIPQADTINEFNNIPQEIPQVNNIENEIDFNAIANIHTNQI